MDKLLNVQEAADYLRVSTRSIFRYLKDGRLRASNIGRWRIKQSDLEKFLNKYLNVRRKRKKKSIK